MTGTRQKVMAATLLVAMAGLAAVGVWAMGRQAPAPRLQPAVEALGARRFEEAAAWAMLCLEADPTNVEARLIAARAALERAEPEPATALDVLSPLESADRPEIRATAAMLQGKAWQAESFLARAEQAWRRALEIDARTAEAPWLLIQLYDLQGRRDEARAVALATHRIETDPLDRAGFLLELVREEVETLAAAGIITRLAPAVANDPQDLDSAVALGVAESREGIEGGLPRLRALAEAHPDRLRCWDAYLGGISDAGDLDALAAALAQVSASLRDDPRIRAHRGWSAQNTGAFAEAIDHYRAALTARPADPKLLYRLGRVLRSAGRDEEAKDVDRILTAADEARKELKTLHDQVKGGDRTGIETVQRLAQLREVLGRPAEAIAWHELALAGEPSNPKSREAVARLAGGAAP